MSKEREASGDNCSVGDGKISTFFSITYCRISTMISIYWPRDICVEQGTDNFETNCMPSKLGDDIGRIGDTENEYSFFFLTRRFNHIDVCTKNDCFNDPREKSIKYTPHLFILFVCSERLLLVNSMGLNYEEKKIVLSINRPRSHFSTLHERFKP